MEPALQNFWEALFRSPAEPGQGFRVRMRLLLKGGRPFLLLPEQSRPAAATMELYPAQTGRARAARAILGGLLRASLAPGTEKVSFTIASDDSFARFLCAQAGQTLRGLPPIGILAGNPMSEGQRLLVLVFNAQQQPVAVVKVGRTEQARTLIEKETAFFSAAPAGTTALPRLRATFDSPPLRALALDFFAGDSPRPQQEAALPSLLESWIDSKRTVRLSDTPDWGRLRKAAPANGHSGFLNQLGERTVAATIAHGDFTPWNIKVSPTGIWTVLDWERGEVTGVPGWDWFHYLIQNAILVKRLPTPALVQRVEDLLGSGHFRQYAARARIAGCERELVQAYLLHMAEVVKPAEGLPATRELLQGLSSRSRL